MSQLPDESAEPARAHDLPLRKVLGKTREVKESIDEAVVDLTVVNEVLQANHAEPVPVHKLQAAIAQNAEVEATVAKAAEDLDAVHTELTEEVAGHAAMAEELAEVKSDLEDTREVLSEVQMQADASRHSALHDPLTGLANRALFGENLEQAMAIARRQGWGLAVLFIDIDAFKSVNDRFGHQVGDAALLRVANCLRTFVRDGDTVSRWGGDEFTCLLLEVASEADALTVATNVTAQLKEECQIGDARLTVAVSIGVALFPQDGETAAPLLKHADQAMYEAKQSGQGVVMFQAKAS